MDLSLKGSQINLATRQKPKAKYASYLSPSLRAGLHFRPCSAGSIEKSSQSAIWLPSGRPKSADCYLEKDANNFYNNKLNKQIINKRFQSISSLNLYKLLLDEPIKRPWLCKRSTSSLQDDEILNNRSSLLDLATNHSNQTGENNSKTLSNMNSPYHSRCSKANISGNCFSSGKLNNTSLVSNRGDIYDLPGRVSFSRHPPETSPSDAELTDIESVEDILRCEENNRQHNKEENECNNRSKDISAPGPVSIIDYTHLFNGEAPSLSKESSNLSLKKSVHFSPSMNNENDSDAGVIAHTYEYHKCPSENCSCSTQSSSSSSQPETSYLKNNKCNCNSNLFKRESSLDAKQTSWVEKNRDLGTKDMLDELPAIRKYKNVISDGGNNLSEAKFKSKLCDMMNVSTEARLESGKLDKGCSHKCSVTNTVKPLKCCNSDYHQHCNCGHQNDNLHSYHHDDHHQDHYHHHHHHQEHTTLQRTTNKPNNLHKKTMPGCKSEMSRNDFHSKMDNKLEPLSNNTNTTVINNYLKVATSTSGASKKKENNRPMDNSKNSTKICSNSLQNVTGSQQHGSGSHCHNHENHMPRSKARVKYSISPIYRRTSSLTSRTTSPGIRCTAMTSKKLSNSRDEGKKKAKCLPEFDIDQVESWMTMCEKQTHQDQSISCLSKSLATLEQSFEKLSKGTVDLLSSSLPDDVSKEKIKKKVEHNENDKDLIDRLSLSSQDDSTYDDIVSVIKEIDEDKMKDNSPVIEEIQDLDLRFSPRQQSRSSGRGRDVSVGTNGDIADKGPDKLQDILSYLDNVEDSCEKTLLETRRSIPESNRSEVEFVVEPDIVEDVPKLADLLMLPNHQLARRVVALSLRANELSNALILSKELVNKLRSEKQRLVRTEKSQASVRLKEQKKSYEAIVKRHQGFIEQLLKDKENLCEKVGALTRRLESQNQAWEHRLETEIVRVKENTLAGEKIRRERWIRENTKKIKELTVKGLEAEINKMAANHQREINELKQNHQQQILDAVEEVRLRHEQIENNIRENSAQDREVLIAKERNAIIERFDKQLMEERQSFYEQKAKLVTEFQEEKDRLVNGFRAKEIELEQRRAEWQRDKDLEGQQRLEEMQEKFNKQEESYQNRMNTIEKQYESDFELWKKEYENNCKIQQAEKENLIRQHYRTERDRQIDEIVQKMDSEALKTNEEFEAKIGRLKEKHDKDLKELENAESSVREKYAETRSKLAESDAQVRNFEAEIKQLQIELEHSKKMCNDYLKEREQIHDQIKGEMQEKYQTVKAERDQEIQQIHKRVQQAIEKKDATVDLLQKENGSLRERCLKLEAVIRQQRKDYCVK